MPQESSVTLIEDLDPTYPANSDAKSAGGQQFRFTKTAVKSLNTASSTAGAAQVGFIQAGTGASSRRVQAKLRELPLTPEDYGASGDGSTDDLTPLTNFINALLANPNVWGKMPAKVYAVSGSLPQINVSGFRLEGAGPSSNHSTGAATTCTVIKRITNAGGDIMHVAPTSGALNKRIEGVRIVGISFDCNSLAARGLWVQSVMSGYFHCYAQNGTTASIELGVVAQLVEARDVQDNTFIFTGRNDATSAPVLKLNGDSTANVSLNRFPTTTLIHDDGTGLVCVNPDNNHWGNLRVFHLGGSATHSVEWQGGATSAEATRVEVIDKLTSTLPAIAKGTSSYTVAAKRVLIKLLDSDNGTPVPEVEEGAMVAGPWIDWTPTVTSGSGTLTTTSALGEYRHDPNEPSTTYFRMSLTITNAGTGSGNIQATLPFTVAADNIGHVAYGYEAVNTGKGCRAVVAQGGTSLIITFDDGTYPGATGALISVNGWFKTQT